MVALALKCLGNPASPFYLKLRLDLGLLSWGYKFWRAANPDHVRRAAPLLRDLSLRAGPASKNWPPCLISISAW